VLTRSRISLLLFLFKGKSNNVIFEAHEPLNSIWLQLVFRVKEFSIIAISEALSDLISLELGSSKKITVMHDGSDLIDFSDFVIELKINPKIVYVGTLGRGRGIDLILKLAQFFVNCDFHIIGKIEESINETSISSENLFFHGWKSKVQILDIVKNADVLLAPYQNDLKLDNGINSLKFMSPLKIFEYMSFNGAMIVSDYPVIREVLENEIDSLLVNPSNFDDWKIAITRILSNPDFAKFLNMNARKKLVDRYTWEKRAKRILSLFK